MRSPGRTPVLPRFALGNWWSRYHRYTADEYLALIDRFAAEGIPFSVARPRHGLAPGRRRPAVRQRLDRLHLEPRAVPGPGGVPARAARAAACGSPSTCTRPTASARSRTPTRPWLGPSAWTRTAANPIAFDVTDREFLAAYFEVLHRALEREGVDFWWIDWQSGPHSRVAGIDPLWMLNHFHFLDNARDGKRPLTFSRYAGPGSHRYPVGFSGDTLITLGVAGLPAVLHRDRRRTSATAGGATTSAATCSAARTTSSPPDGCSSASSRRSCGCIRACNPFITKEPWPFGAEAPRACMTPVPAAAAPAGAVPAHDEPPGRASRVSRWSAAVLVCTPGPPQAYEVPNQFVFGTELLVAPITTPTRPADHHSAAVRAWLPEGTWVDVLNGLVYDGGRELVLHRDLAGIPVLAGPARSSRWTAAAIPPTTPTTRRTSRSSSWSAPTARSS